LKFESGTGFNHELHFLKNMAQSVALKKMLFSHHGYCQSGNESSVAWSTLQKHASHMEKREEL